MKTCSCKALIQSLIQDRKRAEDGLKRYKKAFKTLVPPKDRERIKKKLGGMVTGLNTEHMRAIGQRGGLKTSTDREHMRALGRRGGATMKAKRAR